MISSFQDFRAKFRAWDRDFGWTYRTAILVAFLVTLVSAPFWFLRHFDSSANVARHQSHTAANTGASNASESTLASSFDATNDSSGGVAQRTLYPYSVIPGGAYSQAELERAIANDPVVARHYADFDVSRTRVERLERAEAMYVSYRIQNRIYWTQRKITLPAGELILTDGKHTARTRCGNRLSVSPATPISQYQPDTMAMDTPPDLRPVATVHPASLPPIFPPPMEFAPMPDMPGSLSPIADTPESAELVPGPLPPPYFPIIGGGAPPMTPIVPPPPPVATPEPATLSLLSTGLLFMALISWRRASKQRRP
ncbi:MAG TPA: PEP-CTERM sorting domain-containing protein [Candidatus Aquilonibacter sp.]|nr:PEP-CTERM sorting domain-containing protein [Candidatus Aquilonibacter sp.]